MDGHIPPTGPLGKPTDSQAPLILALSIIPVVLSCISVALRIYTKHVILRSIGLDDYAIIVAQILVTGNLVVNIVGVQLGGFGRRQAFLTDETMAVYPRALLSAILIYNAAQIVTKVSFLLQYRRLFPIPTIKWICNGGLIFLAIWGVAQQLYTAFSCDPGKYIFPQWTRCIETFVVFNVNAIMNMVTDFVIFIIPIWPVLQLHINARRKVHLLIVFCFGLLACSISVVRLTELLRTYNLDDSTWNLSSSAYLSSLELSIGILCACVPTMRPLIKKIAPRLAGTSQNKSNYSMGHRPTSNTGARSRKQRGEIEKGIYIQKDVEFQSTTELRTNTNGKDPYSLREGSADGISLQDVQVTSHAESNNGPSITRYTNAST